MTPHSLIIQTALSTLEKGINKLLMLDEFTLDKIALLEGKTIAIYSTTPYYRITVIPTSKGIFLTQSSDLPVDAEISASTVLLLQLLMTKNKEACLTTSDFNMVGNIPLLFQFVKILDNLTPNWETELSQWFNPTSIALITHTLKAGNQHIKQSITFIQSQLNLLFNDPTEQLKNKEHKSPFMIIIDSLEKRLKKS